MTQFFYIKYFKRQEILMIVYKKHKKNCNLSIKMEKLRQKIFKNDPIWSKSIQKSVIRLFLIILTFIKTSLNIKISPNFFTI